MRLVRALVAAGLPPPVKQYEVWVDGVFFGRIDLAFPAIKLGIELDSFRWHAGRRPFRDDRQRANRLAAAGWMLLRATTEDAQDPRELVAHAESIFRAAA
jgi:very-short-patch-repair endonuclease